MSLFQEQFNRALASKLERQRAEAELARQQAAWYGGEAASNIALRDAQRQHYEAQAKHTLADIRRKTTPALPEYTRSALLNRPRTSAIDFDVPMYNTRRAPPPVNQSAFSAQPGFLSGYGLSFLDQLNQRFGYADGGPVIPEGSTHPLYKQYLVAMHRAGMLDRVEPPQTVLPRLAQYAAQERLKLAQQTNMGGTQGYARGGEVDVGGKLVVGPGTPKSDSIPAKIDGTHDAALSTGEFVFPRKAVEFYGTKVLDAMVEKARQALRKQAIAQV